MVMSAYGEVTGNKMRKIRVLFFSLVFSFSCICALCLAEWSAKLQVLQRVVGYCARCWSRRSMIRSLVFESISALENAVLTRFTIRLIRYAGVCVPKVWWVTPRMKSLINGIDGSIECNSFIKMLSGQKDFKLGSNFWSSSFLLNSKIFIQIVCFKDSKEYRLCILIML